jgi:hypothetical protein
MENDLMTIRYSSIVGGSGGGADFNLNVGTSGNTTFSFDEAKLAGRYFITSQLSDSSLEFYAIAEDETLAGYTNTRILVTTKDFNSMVVYGATNNDIITFEFKESALASASGNKNGGAAPYITSVSDADLGNIDDTTIITGGNFATDVTVTFTGTDAVVRNAKSVVRSSSTQIIVTRPDAFLISNSPYTLTVSNPGITQSAIRTNTASITAGSSPTWVTAAGSLPTMSPGQAYSTTVEATDPEGSTITYSIASGSLPSGISLNSSTGVISGTAPSPATLANFVISATDASGNSTNRSFSIAPLLVLSGGTLSSDSTYYYRTFTSNGTFSVANGSIQADVLLVAGGGGGRQVGGGAGGVIYDDLRSISEGSYSIAIGGGGGTSNGSDTTGFDMTATGGGMGAIQNNFNGNSGGSGGGGGRDSSTGGSSTQTSNNGGTGYGNKGGNASGTGYGGGGGGGGAGAAGGNGQGNGQPSGERGGDGGIGLNTWSSWASATGTGDSGYYAGGGATPTIPGGAGDGSRGLGGGGAVRQNGQANTGGGAGGNEQTGNVRTGGSGIVIVRYLRSAVGG